MLLNASQLKTHLYEILEDLASEEEKEVIIVNTHKKTRFKLILLKDEIPEYGFRKKNLKGTVDFTEAMDPKHSIPNYSKKK